MSHQPHQSFVPTCCGSGVGLGPPAEGKVPWPLEPPGLLLRVGTPREGQGVPRYLFFPWVNSVTMWSVIEEDRRRALGS